MTEKVRVAVVGAGIGSAHAAALKRVPAAELVAICDLDREKAARLAAEHDVRRVVTDYEELLAMKDVDAVTLGVPNYLHAPMAIAGLAAGKHVLCEKPMAVNAAEAARMVAAAKKSDRIFMMAYNRRFSGEAMLLKQYVEAGELGRIYAARTGWLRRVGIPGWGSWFRRKDQAGGGPLIDLGVHVLDLTLWLMGFPKVKAVSGATYAEFGPTGRGFWGTPAPGSIYDVEDLAMAMIRLADGGTIMLEASWASFTEKEMVYLNLLGTKGGASYDPPRIYTERFGGQVDLHLEAPRINGYEGEMAHFISCIREGKQPIATAEQGYHLISLLEALYRSAELGREVVLDGEARFEAAGE